MRDLASILNDLVEANASLNTENKKKYSEELLNSLSTLSSERDAAARRVKILEQTAEQDPGKIEDELLRHLVKIYLRPLKQGKYSLAEYRTALLSVKVPDHLGRNHNTIIEAITLLSDKPRFFNLENKWKEIRERNAKQLDFFNRKVISLTFETDQYVKHLATSIGEQLKKTNLQLFNYLFPNQASDPMSGHDKDEVIVTDETIIQLSRILSKLSEIRAAHEEGKVYQVSFAEPDLSEDETNIEEDLVGKGKEKVGSDEEADIDKSEMDKGKDDLFTRIEDSAALTLDALIEKNKILALTFEKFDAVNKLLKILQEVPQREEKYKDSLSSNASTSTSSKKLSDADISTNHAVDRSSLDITQEEEELLDDEYRGAEQGNRDQLDFLKSTLITFSNTLDENKKLIGANRDKFGMRFLKNVSVVLAFVGTLSLSHFLWNDFGIKDSQGNKFARKSEDTLYPRAKK